jgi:hypothetical protein
MKPPLVIIGIILLVSATVPIILGSNEVLALNDCSSGSRTCLVSYGGGGQGVCDRYFCYVSPFLGQDTVQGIRSVAYSLVEIGAVLAIIGVVTAVFGARSKPRSSK